MEARLIEPFTRYTELVLTTLRNDRMFDERLGATVISTTSRSKRLAFLPKVVEGLERLASFAQLLQETRSVFREQYPPPEQDDRWIERSVQSFFRCSSFYLETFEGKDVDVQSAFETYVSMFQGQEIRERSLILLEGVDFTCPESCMNFNTFQIRRFSDEELANIFDNRVNQNFYPRAVIDIKPLADYWFIETTRLKARLPLPRGIDLLSFDWGLPDLIEPEYKRFAELFGSPRQILELFPWEPIDHNLYKDEPRPGPLPHPLVIQTDDDLLSPPHYMPHLSGLQTEIWYVDPITGEESERPAIWIRLSQDPDFSA